MGLYASKRSGADRGKESAMPEQPLSIPDCNLAKLCMAVQGSCCEIEGACQGLPRTQGLWSQPS